MALISNKSSHFIKAYTESLKSIFIKTITHKVEIVCDLVSGNYRFFILRNMYEPIRFGYRQQKQYPQSFVAKCNTKHFTAMLIQGNKPFFDLDLAFALRVWRFMVSCEMVDCGNEDRNHACNRCGSKE